MDNTDSEHENEVNEEAFHAAFDNAEWTTEYNGARDVWRSANVAAEAMYAAIKYALDRSQTDGDFGYVSGFGTETWARLCAAEAAYLGKPLAEIEAERKKQFWRYPPRVLELKQRIEEMGR